MDEAVITLAGIPAILNNMKREAVTTSSKTKASLLYPV
jgi:hypothetical protein